MLTDIRLSAAELAALRQAAGHAEAELITSYEGWFTPASNPRCLGLRCISAGQLFRFAGLATLLVNDIGAATLHQLGVRTCEDRDGSERVYYWPGVVAP